MADWTDIKTTKYDGPYGSYVGLSVTLQYDKDADTPTSRTLRFKTSATGSGTDGYYVLWAPGTSKEAVYKVKAYNTAINNSSSFKISKTYSEDSFDIPDYWVCHCGSVAPTSDRYMTFADAGKKTMYWYFTNNRKNFKTVVSSFTSSGKKATAVGTGTVSITDNGNNTFTLKGAKGANGSYNTASGPTLSWGYSTSYGNSFTNNSTKDLTIATESNATRTVYAKCVTGATYGSDKTATTSAKIKQYVAPSAASKISFAPDTKTRLTNKEKWILSWTKGTKTNDSSPVEGYRIRIYVNDKTIAFKNGNKEVVTSDAGSGAGRYYYDRDSTSTSMNFYANLNGLKPGDKVYAQIHCYTKNAKGTKIFSGSAKSSTYTVRHAGVMRIKSDGKWYEGEVYIKADGKWIEADVVHIKSDGKWYESE